MGKKILTALLATALLCGMLTACGGKAESEKDAAYDTYAELILTDWMRYISASEAMYEDLNWAVSYITTFSAQPNWDALLCARAAIELAAKRIELRDEPAWDAPAEAYEYFMDQEIDVSFVHLELEGFESTRQSLLNSCNMLRQDLMITVFFRDGLSRMGDTAATEAKLTGASEEYLAYSTEYLLAQLNDGEWTDKVHASMKEACPRLDALRDASMTAEEAQQAVSSAVETFSDAMEALATAAGRGQAELDLLVEYLDQGDVDAAMAMFSTIDGLPELLPDPGWELTEASYYWTQADGTHRFLTKPEDLTGPPESCVLEFSDVTEDEVVAYVSELYEEIGLDGEWSDREGGYYDVYFQAGGSVLTVSWTEDGAAIYMLENPVCLAPGWFIIANTD